jgi:cyclopropane fatty-acyl-phospholipid synthase-like methyltransferase
VPEWDELFKKKQNRWEEPHELVISFAAELKTRGVRRVLDLGCGAGRHVVYLAREGFDVCGTDVSPRGLKYTRAWLDREGLRADLQLSDMTVIPYPDNYFDAMISTYVIHHNTVDNIRRCVAEIHRTLVIGGRGLLTVQGKHGSRYGKGKQVEPDTFVHNSGPEAGVPHHFFDEQELRELLATFATVELSPLEWEEIKGARRYRHSHYVLVVQK